MNVRPTALPGVVLIEPTVHHDARGSFFEAFHAARFESAGLPHRFVQDNVSFSRRGVLRGLHLQHPHDQGKLVSVLAGSVFDVAVDLRRDSPTFARWIGVELSEDNKLHMYIPPGFAHGFQVTSESALFAYKCTEQYEPSSEIGIRWDDPRIGIRWPLAEPSLSPRDAGSSTLAELEPSRLPSLDSV